MAGGNKSKQFSQVEAEWTMGFLEKKSPPSSVVNSHSGRERKKQESGWGCTLHASHEHSIFLPEYWNQSQTGCHKPATMKPPSLFLGKTYRFFFFQPPSSYSIIKKHQLHIFTILFFFLFYLLFFKTRCCFLRSPLKDPGTGAFKSMGMGRGMILEAVTFLTRF